MRIGSQTKMTGKHLAALGRHLAELIVDGETELDGSRYDVARLARG